MGHYTPNMIGVEPGKLDETLRRDLRLPGYMTMGQNGMAEMGQMGMKMPANSIAMASAQGPFDFITMGGMFSILKVRANLPQGYEQDPGWYQHPVGTRAMPAQAEDLRRDGLAVPGAGVKG